MAKANNEILSLLKRQNELLEAIHQELRAHRLNPEYISKEDVKLILGWQDHEKAARAKLALLREHGILSRPSHAPFMYIADEVKKVKEDIGVKYEIRRTKTTCVFVDLTKASK